MDKSALSEELYYILLSEGCLYNILMLSGVLIYLRAAWVKSELVESLDLPELGSGLSGVDARIAVHIAHVMGSYHSNLDPCLSLPNEHEMEGGMG